MEGDTLPSFSVFTVSENIHTVLFQVSIVLAKKEMDGIKKIHKQEEVMTFPVYYKILRVIVLDLDFLMIPFLDDISRCLLNGACFEAKQLSSMMVDLKDAVAAI